MRQLILIFLLFTSFIITAQSTLVGRFPFDSSKGTPEPPPEPPTWTNLIGHWPMINNSLADFHDSDDMTATNAVNSGDSCWYFDGTGDYLSFTGTTNTVCTWMLELYPLSTDALDILGATGAGMELYLLSSSLRPRIVIGGGGGTTPVSLSLTVNQWNWVTVTISDASNTVRYGINGVYESETDWTETTSAETNRIGSFTAGLDFYGYIRNVWKFSDLKADSYNTLMEDRTYEEGDPE